MAKTASEIVKASQKRTGRVRKQVALLPDKAEQLDRLVARFGSITAVFEAGMNALDGRNETDWPSELRRLATELETRR